MVANKNSWSVNFMYFVIILNFINLLFAGLLAGAEFMAHYGMRSPAETLDARPQLQLRQALVLRLRVLVPALFIPTALSGIAVTILAGMTGLLLHVVALIGIAIWILLRVVGTVRINSATVDWQLDAPPQDWQAQVANAERFHIVGVWSVLIAFACFLAAVLFNLPAL
jgi:hypothetical protein